MKPRFLKMALWSLVAAVLISGTASMFPATSELFDCLPYWALCPLRVCAAAFLVFMFVGYLIDSGILHRIFGKK